MTEHVTPENYVGPLSTGDISRVLEYELNYLKFIGVVDEGESQ